MFKAIALLVLGFVAAFAFSAQAAHGPDADEADFTPLIFAKMPDAKNGYAALLQRAENGVRVREANPDEVGGDPYADSCFEAVQANFVVAWRPRSASVSRADYTQARDKVITVLHAVKKKIAAERQAAARTSSGLDGALQQQLAVDQAWFGDAVLTWLNLYPQATDDENDMFFAVYHAEQCVTEDESVRLLRRVFKTVDWPDDARFGAGASHAAWVLAQHADHHPQVQKEALARLRRAVEAGKAARSDYAFLQDRVQVRAGLPQVYGTQFRAMCGGNRPYPILDEAHLDDRRKAAGLSPFADYERSIGRPCKDGSKTQ